MEQPNEKQNAKLEFLRRLTAITFFIGIFFFGMTFLLEALYSEPSFLVKFLSLLSLWGFPMMWIIAVIAGLIFLMSLKNKTLLHKFALFVIIGLLLTILAILICRLVVETNIPEII